jgi:hypothetical protein
LNRTEGSPGAARLDGDETVAIYEPKHGGWTARTRWVQISEHIHYRFHIAVIDPNGHAAYTTSRR